MAAKIEKLGQNLFFGLAQEFCTTQFKCYKQIHYYLHSQSFTSYPLLCIYFIISSFFSLLCPFVHSRSHDVSRLLAVHAYTATLPLYLIITMKAYGGVETIAPHILNLGAKGSKWSALYLGSFNFLEKGPLYSLDMWQGVVYTQPRCSEQKNS